MNDNDVIHLIWDVFGVAVNYGTDRKEIEKALRNLAS